MATDAVLDRSKHCRQWFCHGNLRFHGCDHACEAYWMAEMRAATISLILMRSWFSPNQSSA